MLQSAVPPGLLRLARLDSGDKEYQEQGYPAVHEASWPVKSSGALI